MIDPQDLAYLQAELAQAQSQGARTLNVRVNELQSLLSRYAFLDRLPKQPVVITGYARPGELAAISKRSLMTIRVRRVPNEWCTQPVYVDPKECLHEPA